MELRIINIDRQTGKPYILHNVGAYCINIYQRSLRLPRVTNEAVASLKPPGTPTHISHITTPVMIPQPHRHNATPLPPTSPSKITEKIQEMEFVEFTDLLPNNATSEYDNVVWKDYIIPLNNLVK